MNIDYTIGTVMSIKRVTDNTFALDVVDRCLYDHDENKWPDVIARSRRVRRFDVLIKGSEVICDDDRVRVGLERRLKAAPDLLRSQSFTFKLAL